MAKELNIDLSYNNYFIEDYQKSKIEIKNFNIEVLNCPIILGKNFEILDKAIVWDLYSYEYGTIYVGQINSMKKEIRAIKLYIENDKEGTILRRSEDYGYSKDKQYIVDKIWNYTPFVVRIVAIADEGDSRSVRAYEAIWNEECNEGKGALIKQ